jgi:hypothetical protein
MFKAVFAAPAVPDASPLSAAFTLPALEETGFAAFHAKQGLPNANRESIFCGWVAESLRHVSSFIMSPELPC